MTRLAISLLSLLLATGAASAQDAAFKGKTVTLIVASPAGGGTDTSGRLIASLIAKHLPGKPSIIVRNIPGAEGMTAMNYFVKQVVPDGYTITMGSTTQADPLLYRRSQSQFDPTKFAILGGVGRGGTLLLIRKEAEARLLNHNGPPAIMGALSGVPRSGMVMTAWGIAYLDWNAKWVLGYRGTTDLMVALDRGEIDMTTTANLFQLHRFVSAPDRFKVMAQSGSLQKGQTVARPDFGDAPVFARMMDGKIKDPIVQKAFDYWLNLTSLDKWLALPPKTPEPFVRAYREAYAQAVMDPEFSEYGRKLSEDIEPMAYEDVQLIIDRLGATPPQAIAAISTMLRKQGVEAGE